MKGSLLVELTLKTVKTKETSKLLLQMRVLLASVTLIAVIIWTVGHIGVVRANIVEESIQYLRSFVISIIIVASLWIVVNIRWSSAIITSLDTHLKSMSAMLTGEAAKSAADLQKLENALKRLKQLRVLTTAPFFLVVGCGIVGAVLPVLMQFWFITISLAAIVTIGTLFALRPTGWVV